MKKGFNGIIEMVYTKNSNSLPPSYKKKKHKFNSKTFSNYLEIGKKIKMKDIEILIDGLLK